MSIYGAPIMPAPNPAAGQHVPFMSPAAYVHPPGSSNNVNVPLVVPNMAQVGPFEGVDLRAVYDAVQGRPATVRVERDHPEGPFLGRLAAVFEVASLHASADAMWRNEMPPSVIAYETAQLDVTITRFPAAVAKRINDMGPTTAPVNLTTRITADVVKFGIGFQGSTNHRLTTNGQKVWLQEIAVCLQSFSIAAIIYMWQIVLSTAYTRGASTWRLGLNQRVAITDALNRQIALSFAAHFGCMGRSADGHEQTINALDAVLQATNSAQSVSNLYTTLRHQRYLTRFQHPDNRDPEKSSQASVVRAEKGLRAFQATPRVSTTVVHPMQLGHGVDNFEALGSSNEFGLYYPAAGAADKVAQVKKGEYTRQGDFVPVYDFVSDSSHKFSQDEADRHAGIFSMPGGAAGNTLSHALLDQWYHGTAPLPVVAGNHGLSVATFYARAGMGYIVAMVRESERQEDIAITAAYPGAVPAGVARPWRDVLNIMNNPADQLTAASCTQLGNMGVPLFWSHIAVQPHLRMEAEGVMATSAGGVGYSVLTPMRFNKAEMLNRLDRVRMEMGVGGIVVNQDRVALAPGTSITGCVSGGSAVPHTQASSMRVFHDNSDANPADESVYFLPVLANEIGPLASKRTFDFSGHYPASNGTPNFHYSSFNFVRQHYNITQDHSATTAEHYLQQIGSPFNRRNTMLLLGPTTLSTISNPASPQTLQCAWPGKWYDGFFGDLIGRTGAAMKTTECVTAYPS